MQHLTPRLRTRIQTGDTPIEKRQEEEQNEDTDDPEQYLDVGAIEVLEDYRNRDDRANQAKGGKERFDPVSSVSRRFAKLATASALGKATEPNSVICWGVPSASSSPFP